VQQALNSTTETALLAKLRVALPERNLYVNPDNSSGRRLLYSEGPQDPGSVYLYEAKTQKLELLSNMAAHLEGRPLAATERFVIKSRDGFDIESFLTKAATSANQKLPLLVLPHGGPIGIADYKRFDREVQYCAKIGYAVLQVNFRGSGAGKSNADRGAGVWGTTSNKPI
jgi:dipeptidyl aminopeptidase/acylaminoacyl peptidase